ncbi:MAG: hypothetical protein MUC47_01095 [Candidatus Kapabacteria bacterium]|nr:hypothetical protein [Candidatus Kapabacteria bacterium]
MTLRTVPACLIVILWTVLTSCNDKATDIGNGLVPGTDSLYVVSSADSSHILDSVVTILERPRLFNNTFFLLGKTDVDDARIFIEFVGYPNLGRPEDYEVLASDLLMIPDAYKFGDTTDNTMAFSVHELTRLWTPTSTWDTIYAPTGQTDYYNPTSTPIASFSKSLTAQDSVVPVPFDLAATKRYLTWGVDSALKKQLFGLVMLPTSGRQIRLFRNSRSAQQVMKLRVITKHKDSTANDTTFVESVILNLVHSPTAAVNVPTTQGAQGHKIAFDVNLQSLPSNAIILDATLSLTYVKDASRIGNLGMDEVLRASIVPQGSPITYEYRSFVDASTQRYDLRNLAAPLQLLLRQANKRGRVRVAPDDFREFWRMNRQVYHPLSADPSLRPKLTIVYTVPNVLP